MTNLIVSAKKKKSVVIVNAEGCTLKVRGHELKVDTFFLSHFFPDTCKISLESSSLEKGDESISLSAVNTAIRIYRLLIDLASPLDKVYLMSLFGKDIDRMMYQNIMIKCLVKSSYLAENISGQAVFYANEDGSLILNTSSSQSQLQTTYYMKLTKSVATSILKFIIENQP